MNANTNTTSTKANHMSPIIHNLPTQCKNYFNQKTASTRITPNFSSEDSLKAESITLKRTAKTLFLLIGKLLEINGWCRASRPELAYMLSEKLGKALCPKQISRLTNGFAALGIATKTQTVKHGKHSYNEYQLTDLGWALFYLYNFRNTKKQKCPTEETKNVPPLITKSINKDLTKPTSVVDSEILRETQPANKEVGINLNLVLEERLRDIHREVADKIRIQVKKYMSTNKIFNPNAFFGHVIKREVSFYKNKFTEHEEQQRFFRAKASQDIARTMGFLEKPRETEDKKRLKDIFAECKRRAAE
jgi:hypothetical protein